MQKLLMKKIHFKGPREHQTSQRAVHHCRQGSPFSCFTTCISLLGDRYIELVRLVKLNQTELATRQTLFIFFSVSWFHPNFYNEIPIIMGMFNMNGGWERNTSQV